MAEIPFPPQVRVTGQLSPLVGVNKHVSSPRADTAAGFMQVTLVSNSNHMFGARGYTAAVYLM